ncbi:MAG TPA: uroporphyrinogen decarboxylase [Alphaproteobacteria bacterium]|nr:uroporphyrinogen decarboxylase [Alphaproteobacteria bacterium]
MIKKEFLLTFKGVNSRTSLWLMRQAGRYLPEYRELRAKAKNFMDFCFNPELAAEATLQPIRRFGFDAAIIFSDILVIPYAFGQSVDFIEGVGPKLSSLPLVDILSNDRLIFENNKLLNVFKAIKIVKDQLPKEVSLIGFSGCPWTLACYMIDQGSSKDFFKTRLLAVTRPDLFQKLINILSDAVFLYLKHQIEAGAEAVQLFDSWVGLLPPDGVWKWSISPVSSIISRLKNHYPSIPIIVFPKGSYQIYVDNYHIHKADAISADTTVDFSKVKIASERQYVIQGNLDPFDLLGTTSALKNKVDNILKTMQGKKFIFNLGHGILPETPIDNVYRLVEQVKAT